jgi:hypothetical protein
MSETAIVNIIDFKMSLTFIPIIGTGPIGITGGSFSP